MKKTALLLLLSLASFSYAQEKTTTDTIAKKCKDDDTRLFVGFISNVNDDLNLNQKLRSQNLPDMHNYLPGFAVGINHFGKKVSTDYMMGFLFNSHSQGSYKLAYSGLDLRLSIQYNFINKTKFAFTGGLSTAYTFNYYYLIKNNNVIDLNNLTPENSPGGMIIFNNGMFYVGPSLSAYLFRNTQHKVKLNVGYEFALTNGKYHNYYGGGVANNITETGNNRFVFGITLL